MASKTYNHKFQVDEIVTIKAINDCDLSYGKIKKIHDDNMHYDIEQIPSNEIKRGLHKDKIEMVALVQYAAYTQKNGSPPKWPMQLINYAEENGIANKWIKYVDAKWVIDNKPDISRYNQLPPPIRQPPRKEIKHSPNYNDTHDQEVIDTNRNTDQNSLRQPLYQANEAQFKVTNEQIILSHGMNCEGKEDEHKQETQSSQAPSIAAIQPTIANPCDEATTSIDIVEGDADECKQPLIIEGEDAMTASKHGHASNQARIIALPTASSKAPLSEQTQLMEKLIYKAIEEERHNYPILSTNLVLECMFIFNISTRRN